jgi:hypothetical protein
VHRVEDEAPLVVVWVVVFVGGVFLAGFEFEVGAGVELLVDTAVFGVIGFVLGFVCA